MSQHSPQNPIGSPFIELQSVDSTNNYARKQVYADLAQHGMTVFTHEQTAGKGQRGKVWQSQKDENIALSILINPQPISLANQFQLSACVAVAVHDFFYTYAGDDTKIKWPNDLYWQDRKAGGILIESVIGSPEPVNSEARPSQASLEMTKWKWAIAGIGININQVQFAPELINPVSLKQITGKTFSPLTLAHELCRKIEEKYLILTGVGFAPLYEEYLACLYKKGQLVKLRKENRVFNAQIKTVLPDGNLVIEHATEEIIAFGEVEWIPETKPFR
ncbi:MAG: biotin--[acetyl-CoA-carboxylase] ligase [Bacteroidetes bacterium]|nr:biotin--[acetyl-CoA-carboxylase] ligase [Bacteroidota bacterium]